MKRLKLSVLVLLIIAMPLGVAVQNLAAWLAIVSFLYVHIKNRVLRSGSQDNLSGSAWNKPLLMTTMFSLIYIVWLGFSTWFNPSNPANFGAWAGALAGYAPWIFLPFLAGKLIESQSAGESSELAELRRLLFHWVLPFWALLAFSQYLWGWGVSGDSLLMDLGRLDRFRPRVFYSHPLSLAYVALLIWPFALGESLREASLNQGWKRFLITLLPMLSAGVLIVLTASRTVQAVALAILISMVLIKAIKKNLRSAVMGVFAAGIFLLGVFGSTGSKWQDTVSDQSADVQSHYRDDRLAFWHAHWEMFKERPILGHGWKLGTQYRTPYYERIGLGEFSKKYEAHNMFLQILVNGGLIGFIIFAAWGVSVWWTSRGDWIFRLLLIGLFLASLTQNSLQDYEVRFVFTGLFVLSLFRQRNQGLPNEISD